ncbi:hypothetical protein B5G43_02890 [Flavonifractor sp. An92]|uniref:DUF6711 family protein n=1 Tax=Flavonifractor sp. An92 TaxID=1965666 RepID=UPI000B3680ED|nr:DUF6711 family protein [Flavonifractor sp. An92]OUN08342.1 hypothetical protein B5G43_02890 [Flavonifractor sp. An92]
MTPLVSIGGYAVPAPSTYSATTATLVDSGRNVQGYVIGAVIRNDIAKIEMSWNFISAADWAALLSQFSPARGGSFYNDVTFFCQDSNSWETRQMYVSDRTASLYLRNEDGSVRGYTGASLSLVEV